MVYVTSEDIEPERINSGDSIVKTVCCDSDFETLIYRQVSINGFPLVVHRCLSCNKKAKLKLT